MYESIPKPTITLSNVAREKEVNIPNAPKDIKKIGKVSFKILNIMFLIRMLLAALYAIKMTSIIMLRAAPIINKINKSIYTILFCKNSNGGEKNLSPDRKITETIIVVIIVCLLIVNKL